MATSKQKNRLGGIVLTAGLAALVIGCGDEVAGPNNQAPADVTVTCPSLVGSTAVSSTAPATLLATGLYCDVASQTVAPGIQQFRPKYELWSDGAVKTRWVSLPPGSQIDMTDPDHWSFPVGTRFWKELQYQGQRVETRMIVRYGAGPDDFLFAAYQWKSDGTDATLVPASGAPAVAPLTADADGPQHDIPGTGDCATCHGKLPERMLGFGAIQLSHDLGGLTLAGLAQQKLLTPEPTVTAYDVPGDATAQAALGYLQANCSHCHNDTPTGVTYPRYMLRLSVADTSVESTHTYQTAVNVLHTWLAAPEGVGPYRIQGGDADDSELYFRTGVRIDGEQMPPIATKIVDANGHALLKQWIDGLPPPAAAPSN
jgi:hypothetical protein